MNHVTGDQWTWITLLILAFTNVVLWGTSMVHQWPVLSKRSKAIAVLVLMFFLALSYASAEALVQGISADYRGFVWITLMLLFVLAMLWRFTDPPYDPHTPEEKDAMQPKSAVEDDDDLEPW